MPRAPVGRDRLLRYLLGSTARNFPRPPAYPGANRSLYELAKRSETAFSWVHATLTRFEDEGWVRRAQGRIEVARPLELYRWWKQHHTRPKVHARFVPDPMMAVPTLRANGIAGAFTTYYAENALQGHLFPRRGDVYVPAPHLKKALAVVSEELGAQVGGTNLRVLAADGALLDESTEIGKGAAALKVVPVPQLILDLLVEGGSAGEAAEMLIAKAHPHARPRLR